MHFQATGLRTRLDGDPLKKQWKHWLELRLQSKVLNLYYSSYNYNHLSTHTHFLITNFLPWHINMPATSYGIHIKHNVLGYTHTYIHICMNEVQESTVGANVDNSQFSNI